MAKNVRILFVFRLILSKLPNPPRNLPIANHHHRAKAPEDFRRIASGENQPDQSRSKPMVLFASNFRDLLMLPPRRRQGG